MTTEKFIKNEFENIREKIQEYYRIQRAEDRTWFVYEPMPTLEEIINEFECALDNPPEILEEEMSEDEEQILISKLENKISAIYEDTVKIRKAMKRKIKEDDA